MSATFKSGTESGIAIRDNVRASEVEVLPIKTYPTPDREIDFENEDEPVIRGKESEELMEVSWRVSESRLLPTTLNLSLQPVIAVSAVIIKITPQNQLKRE